VANFVHLAKEEYFIANSLFSRKIAKMEINIFVKICQICLQYEKGAQDFLLSYFG
jgi:hypothetical protein